MQSLLNLNHHLQDILQRLVANSKQSQQHVYLLDRDASLFVAVVDGDADCDDDRQQD